jgi:SOS-response transcriptional repressor LexA
MLKTVTCLCVVTVISFGCSKNSGTARPNSTVSQASNSPAEQSSGNSAPAQNIAGDLRFKVPEGWTTETPTSEMRVAQYKLAKADGDSEDALLVVYYFGRGQGGSTQANIDRWISQIKQPDGQPSNEKAKTETLNVNGLQVTTVDVTGTYAGGMSPDSAPANNKSIYRLRAAVVETPKGSYFLKLTGPEKTVGHWDQAYNDYLKSFEFK